MKTCKCCGKTKPYEGFSRRPDTRDGYMNRCRECMSAASLAHYAANKGKAKSEPEPVGWPIAAAPEADVILLHEYCHRSYGATPGAQLRAVV